MLANSLTVDCCKKILANVLLTRSWTVARVARVIGASVDYVRRVQSGEQSFQVSDVEQLADALGKQAHELIFETINKDDLSEDQRGLYELGVKQIGLHRKMQRLLAPKPAKKRRVRSSAA